MDLRNNPIGIFNVVTNLNIGRPILEEMQDTKELVELADLNYMASEQMKKSVDYVSSLNYIRIASDIVFDKLDAMLAAENKGIWVDHYELCAKISLTAQNICYINSNPEDADKYFQMIHRNFKSEADLTRSFVLKINYVCCTVYLNPTCKIFL